MIGKVGFTPKAVGFGKLKVYDTEESKAVAIGIEKKDLIDMAAAEKTFTVGSGSGVDVIVYDRKEDDTNPIYYLQDGRGHVTAPLMVTRALSLSEWVKMWRSYEKGGESK